MSNEIREKDHEWVKTFHSNFDRLLALLEKLLEKRQPSAYGDELLTDKEVAYMLKVSRRTLQDYRNNGILPYTQVGGKILYRASDIEKTLMKGKHSKKCTFYTLRFGCSFAAVNTIKPQLL